MSQINKSGISLDIRGGSFCIFNSDTLETLCCGERESFRSHDDMRKFANQKFDSLCKKLEK